ncbi:hypothetical protein Ahy_B01g052460 isoform F [Arachis hypogaea]|uniref:RRM domain-containing protein n=1 Tax=Arachis hypogaea TaxID=3818 RepID=A0A445APL5_ARAHY|nr:hypothetical protein Ahy_B01g052460 isoform F [Arachis hypogaea]
MNANFYSSRKQAMVLFGSNNCTDLMNMMLASFPVYPKPFASVRAEFHTQQSSFLKFAPHSYPLASKILVKNLPYTTGETTLQKEFSNFGKIAEVKVAKDVKTKRSKGYAFIQYMCQDDAMLALETMDQKPILVSCNV